MYKYSKISFRKQFI